MNLEWQCPQTLLLHAKGRDETSTTQDDICCSVGMKLFYFLIIGLAA